ncbi:MULTISPECIES: peptidoglycan-associated lipoprotein Pal [Desulfosediminicola]|uniref:peptidoglycan-associated lipoprotein Pal n=1 Tax=Desulfosediminicola TaxID=2886823 RepID=UPI0010ACABD1|nr:peptidoglycan-associated lipoprotein Pal [Desulfosediminicola ganghwensis]
MKTRISSTLLVTALAGSLILFAGGCSKKSVIPPDTNSQPSLGAGTNINYPAADREGYSEENLPVEGTLDDTYVNNIPSATDGGVDSRSGDQKFIQGRTSEGMLPVYFSFDQATIKPDMVENMVNNASYLKEVPAAHVIVEGNTDDRGTKEYNLALAERRAQNTRQYLIDLGVDPIRVRTVSYGEEKPLFLGQDEESYAKNRRADFVLE